jgi:hypothetical protein
MANRKQTPPIFSIRWWLVEVPKLIGFLAFLSGLFLFLKEAAALNARAFFALVFMWPYFLYRMNLDVHPIPFYSRVEGWRELRNREGAPVEN